MRTLLVSGLVLGLTACAPRKPGTSPAENLDQVSTSSAITLERTACFGRCPIYRISVTPAGGISYEGKAHVRHLGVAMAQISPEKVNALLSEFDRAGYFSLADRYTPDDPACGRSSTDSPSAITSIQLRGRTKRIEHDYGCAGAPATLVVLERRIDEVLGSAQWTGR